MTWQGSLLTVAIALATALAGGWFQRPKVRGEGRKAEGEGDLSAANARIAEQIATLQQTRNEADRADEARQKAELARDQCQAEKRQMRSDFDAFVDFMEELVPLLPDTDSQRKARVAIRAIRLSI